MTSTPLPPTEVRGGSLQGFGFGPTDASAPTMLALHGITANHLSWAVVARQLPDTRILALDLRGRGLNSELPGPFGMAAHADDAAAMLRAQASGPVPVVGHSMGAFVAITLAVRYPELVERLILVDGGAPLPKPQGMETQEPSEVARQALGPAIERLAKNFPSRDTYLAIFRQHPALAPHWSADIEAYATYDLAGKPPELRSRTSPDAVLADFAELFVGGAIEGVASRVQHPTSVLRAPRGLMDGAPLYPPGYLDSWASTLPEVRVHEVSDVNHYTIVLGEVGAARVAAEVRG